MKIAVIGETGQLARALAATNPGTDQLIFLGRDKADLTDPQTVSNALTKVNPDAVINAAAYTNVDAAERDEAVATQVNGHSVGALARWAADRHIPLIHVSTDYVLDGKGDNPRAPNALPAPLGAYGRSKLVGEQAISSVGGTFAILRTAWVFSEFGNNFVKTMLRLGASKASVTVVDDQIGGPTPASALASATLSAARGLSASPSLSGIYHFSGTPEVSWAEFASSVFETARLSTTVTPISSRDYAAGLASPPAPRPSNSRLECSATTDAFSVLRPDWRIELARIVSLLQEEAARG